MFATKPLVFISYSRTDKDKVESLSRRLSSSGARTWVDTHDILGGDWRREIKRALRHSNLFVACLSQNTAQRGEVLQFEYDSALEIQREMLEGDIYIVPVRLEPCEIPESLKHLQVFDLYEAEGWDSLVRVVWSKRRQTVPSGVVIAMAVLLAALGGYLRFRPNAQSELLSARAQGKAATAGRAVQLGVTLWKMEASQDSDPPSVREIVQPKPEGGTGAQEWTPVRLSKGATFHVGDNFQIAVESSRAGYLYLVNRTLFSNGSTGPSRLIFPTDRSQGGDNQVWPGKVIRLPDRNSKPPYWQFQSSRPDYTGELLIVLLSPRPLDTGGSQEDATEVSEATLADWSKQLGGGVSLTSSQTDQLRLTPEEAAARDRGTQLSRNAPPPQYIFDANRSPESAVLCTLRIPVSAK